MARTEHVTYECDVCGKTADARVVDTDGGQQHAQPVGWFSIEARHVRREQDRSQRLKADVCSVECGTKQLEEWANG
jgi:hypothetical protein